MGLHGQLFDQAVELLHRQHLGIGQPRPRAAPWADKGLDGVLGSWHGCENTPLKRSSYIEKQVLLVASPPHNTICQSRH